jgi:hypothetical protein
LSFQKYEEYFHNEEELNVHLNVFAINYSAAYGGFNDVKTQIGYDKEDKDKGIPIASNPYFIPDVIGESVTNRNNSYIKAFGISPSPRATDGNKTHDLSIRRQRLLLRHKRRTYSYRVFQLLPKARNKDNKDFRGVMLSVAIIPTSTNFHVECIKSFIKIGKYNFFS